MKKIILFLSILLLVCGCNNINNMDYKSNIDNIIKTNSNNKLYNHEGIGYKYYLPKNMSISNVLNYNEVISSSLYTYYLYIDIVSYYNNKEIKLNKKCYDSYEFSNNNNKGYVCIDLEDDEYYVSIVYNYGKIEVKADKNALNEVINNSIILLSTIKYDKDILENILVENKTGINDETFTLFENAKKNENFLDVVEEYDTYVDEDEIPDYDKIN